MSDYSSATANVVSASLLGGVAGNWLWAAINAWRGKPSILDRAIANQAYLLPIAALGAVGVATALWLLLAENARDIWSELEWYVAGYLVASAIAAVILAKRDPPLWIQFGVSVLAGYALAFSRFGP